MKLGHIGILQLVPLRRHQRMALSVVCVQSLGLGSQSRRCSAALLYAADVQCGERGFQQLWRGWRCGCGTQRCGAVEGSA